MKPDQIIDILESNGMVFKSMLSGKTPEMFHFRTDEKSWSLLEIICHLYDEEREDFRARVKNTLFFSHQPPPSINPQGWVKERKYTEQNYEKKLDTFLDERKNSIIWLRTLENVPWDHFYEHPSAGKISAYSFLANWLAHDYHHIRQINRRMYEYLKNSSGENLAYAGEW